MDGWQLIGDIAQVAPPNADVYVMVDGKMHLAIDVQQDEETGFETAIVIEPEGKDPAELAR